MGAGSLSCWKEEADVRGCEGVFSGEALVSSQEDPVARAPSMHGCAIDVWSLVPGLCGILACRAKGGLHFMPCFSYQEVNS